MYNGAWEPVQRLIPGITLAEYQCRTALSIVTEPKHMILFETGLGKTLTAISGLLMRKNNDTSRRILWLSPLDILGQTREAFVRHTPFRTRVVTGTTKNISKRDYSGLDIVFVNFEAFDERFIVKWMMSVWNSFDTVVVDEAHLISNPFSSNRNGFLWWLASKINNTYLLTATPTVSRIDQYASLLCLLSGTLRDLIGYRNQIHQEKWLPELHPKLLSYKKRDITIPMEVIMFQEEVSRSRNHGTALFKDTRSVNTSQPYSILRSIIKKQGLSHFLVYSNVTAKRFWKEITERSDSYSPKILSADSVPNSACLFKIRLEVMTKENQAQ